MICGALQTLNEEACEDVLDVPSPAVPTIDSLPGEPTSLQLSLPLVIVQEAPMSDQSPDIVDEYCTNFQSKRTYPDRKYYLNYAPSLAKRSYTHVP